MSLLIPLLEMIVISSPVPKFILVVGRVVGVPVE
jgi:hypothetical protein